MQSFAYNIPIISSSPAEIACSADSFSGLCAALQATGLDETLSSGTYTVFAPDNDAFAEFFAKFELTIDTVPMDVLTNVLLYHVAGGEYPSSVLADRCTELLEMADGDDTRTVCRDGMLFQKVSGADAWIGD